MQVVKAALRNTARGTVRRLVASSWTRPAINSLYLKLGPSSRTRFHREFARVFRDGTVSLSQAASWKVAFGRYTLLMPLTPENAWQEWDSAVSITANDMEVKQTYESLLASSQAPDLFVDIGANYGTHSLLFLAAGTDTLTFEPNASCHDYFLRTCALNGFTPHLEKVALGREHGRIELSYPPRDTWNGSTSQAAIAKLHTDELVTSEVELRPLDDYLDRVRRSKRVLVKIDTEGNELLVLQGAKQTLAECKPTVIFESLTTDENRPELYAYLESFGYVIGQLPLLQKHELSRLTEAEFLASPATNFIAAAQ
jgi:FkbM family methyltransferase